MNDATCAATGAGGMKSTPNTGFVLPLGTCCSLVLPVSIIWRPQPDITPYELARLLPILIHYGYPLMPHEVPTEPELLRHIEVRDPNKREGG